jgi:hypothetical protein
MEWTRYVGCWSLIKFYVEADICLIALKYTMNTYTIVVIPLLPFFSRSFFSVFFLVPFTIDEQW